MLDFEGFGLSGVMRGCAKYKLKALLSIKSSETRSESWDKDLYCFSPTLLTPTSTLSSFYHLLLYKRQFKFLKRLKQCYQPIIRTLSLNVKIHGSLIKANAWSFYLWLFEDFRDQIQQHVHFKKPTLTKMDKANYTTKPILTEKN